MGEYAYRGLEETNLYLTTHQQKHAEMAVQLEGAINNLDRCITNYLIEISGGSMSEYESAKHTALMDAVRDIERIGDHFENIVELIDYKISNKVEITEQAQEDVNNMFDLTILTVKQSIHALDRMDREEALAVIQKEDKIDKMERVYRKKHIIRVNDGACDASAGIVFVVIISNLDRVGVHALKRKDREEALSFIQKEDKIDKMERVYRKKHIIRVNEGACDASAGIVFVDIISNLERIGDHAVNIAEEVLGD